MTEEGLEMARTKPKPESPFVGRWRIVSMSVWDEEYIDEQEEGFFEFDEKESGEFRFGYVHGRMNCRLTTRDEVRDAAGEPVAGGGQGHPRQSDLHGRPAIPLAGAG